MYLDTVILNPNPKEYQKLYVSWAVTEDHMQLSLWTTIRNKLVFKKKEKKKSHNHGRPIHSISQHGSKQNSVLYKRNPCRLP